MLVHVANIGEVDFLPASYREQGAKRRVGAWRLVVAALFGVLIVGSATFQRVLGRSAQVELARIEPLFTAAQTVNARFADLQAQLKRETAEADLRTYLRGGWPKTQLLSALISPLPPSVRLYKLHIVREAKTAAGESRPTADKAPAANVPRVEADLIFLKGIDSSQRVVVHLEGVALEPAELHACLEQLGKTPLFEKVELSSFGSGDAIAPGAVQFAAKIVVRPGYGRAGGPTTAPANPTENKPADHNVDDASAGGQVAAMAKDSP